MLHSVFVKLKITDTAPVHLPTALLPSTRSGRRHRYRTAHFTTWKLKYNL